MAELATLKAEFEALKKKMAAMETSQGSTSSSSGTTIAAKEPHINTPKPFTGKQSEFAPFLESILLYFGVNKGTYDTDKKKINYAISLFEGEAQLWKSAFVKSKTTDGVINLGTWDNFVNKLKQDFKEIDETGDSLYALQRLYQGARPAEDYNTEFRILAYKAGILQKAPSPDEVSNPLAVELWKSKDLLLQQMYERGLNRGLHEHIAKSDSPLQTLEEWFSKPFSSTRCGIKCKGPSPCSIGIEEEEESHLEGQEGVFNDGNVLTPTHFNPTRELNS